MKKTLSMLCVVLVVGFAGTAFAGKKEKVDVCHNGSEYIGVVTGAEPLYDQEEWVPAAFVIRISENAVTKHVYNHGDSETIVVRDPETDVLLPLVITEVDVSDGGVITDYEEQQSCVPTTTPEP